MDVGCEVSLCVFVYFAVDMLKILYKCTSAIAKFSYHQ